MEKKEKKLAVILVGAPGSGKGTQGELFEKNTKFKRYVMSSVIKKAIKSDKLILEKVNSGILLSDLDIFAIFRKQFKFENEVILDGIPRTLDQAYWLYGFLKQHDYEIEVIYLNVDEKKLINRILLRAKKEGRKDDNKIIFKHRLKEFDKAKEVILNVYSKNILEFDGDQSIEDIEKEICKKFKKYLVK